MKLGILADSHDNLPAIRYWTEYYNQVSADVLLHAGDFISPFTVPELDRFDGPVYGVFGNNDGDRSTLEAKAQGTNVTFREAPTTLDLTQCSILMSHKPSDLPEDYGNVDLVIHGHTHERKWNGTSRPPVANPGESGGWLSETSSSLFVKTNGEDIKYDFELVPSP